MIEDAGGVDGYEFQRLHGMGEVLYQALLAELPDLTCRVYAPVGGYADLLAYLVRRLLGEWRQFVVRLGGGRSGGADRDRAAAAAKLDRRSRTTRAIRIFRCRATCSLPERRNSAGVEFGDRAALDALLAEIGAAPASVTRRAADRRRGGCRPRARSACRRSTAKPSALCEEGDEAIVAAAMAAAQAGFAAWHATPVDRARRRARTRRRPDRAEPRPR